MSSLPRATRIPLPVAAGAVLVMLLWALCFPLIRVGLRYAPPLTFAALRAALSGMVLVLSAEGLRRPAVRGAGTWAGILFIGLTATSIGLFGMFRGGARVAPGLATVIANTQPLIAAGLARSFLGERLAKIQYWGLAVGFAGIFLIALPALTRSRSEIEGVAYVLLSGVGVAISNLLMKRLAGRVDALRAMGWQFLAGSMPLALMSLSTEHFHAILWTPGFIVTWLVLSLIGTSMSYVLWFVLLRYASLSQLNVFTFLTPIFALVAGAVFFAESTHGIEWAGIALTLLGIYWVNRAVGPLAPATHDGARQPMVEGPSGQAAVDRK